MTLNVIFTSRVGSSKLWREGYNVSINNTTFSISIAKIISCLIINCDFNLLAISFSFLCFAPLDFL